MSKIVSLLAFLLPFLAACSQDLHFKIRYDDIDGLRKGDPVVLDNQPIGKVAGLEETKSGEHLVEVSIPRESAGSVTSEASFVLEADPEQPGKSRIEVVLSSPGGKPIAEGAVVQGTYPESQGFFPFGELLRGFGGALRELSNQLEHFRQEFQKLPNSPEAKQLGDEWRRLTEEIAKAQNQAGNALNKEILPKLEKEMKDLQKRLEEMQKAGPKPGKPLET